MGVERLAHHAMDQVAQAVGEGVEIGLVDLGHVAGEDDLRPLAGPRDDRLHLVGREILRLVDDEEHPLQGAAADVGQRRDHQLLRLTHLQDFVGGLRVFAALVADHREVVVERLHVGVELVADVTRQEAEVAVGQRHHRTGQHDLPVALPAFEGGGQREECLAGAGGAGEGDELDVVVHQGLQGERLLGIPRADAIASLLLDADERRIGAAVGRQRRLAAVAEHEVLVGPRRLFDRQIGCRQPATLRVEPIDHLGVDPFDRPLAGVERVEALDLVGGVVLGAEAERLGLHPQVRVLGDEDHGPRR